MLAKIHNVGYEGKWWPSSEKRWVESRISLLTGKAVKCEVFERVTGIGQKRLRVLKGSCREVRGIVKGVGPANRSGRKLSHWQAFLMGP